MAFSFGAPPSTPAASGAATGGFTFGGTSSATPPKPAFGFGAPAAAPAPSAFSFGGSPAASAPAPVSGFSFAAASTPAPATGFSFGATSTPAPAPAGSVFGATAAKPATGFSFGATSAPAPGAAPLFGAAPAAAPPLFGTTTPAPFGTSTGLFGAPQAAAGATAPGLTPTPTSEIEAALKALYLAYADKNPTPQPAPTLTLGAQQPAAPQFNKDCRFKHLFYNMVGAADRQRYQRPDFVDSRVWDRAERDNPNPEVLAPTPVVGFAALKERVEHQHGYTSELNAFIKRIENTLHTLEQASSQTETLVQKGFHRHRQLCNRFLQVLRKLEVLRSMGLPLQLQERELHIRLEAVANHLAAPTQRLTDLHAHSTQVERPIDHSEKLKDKDLAKLHAALQHQRKGLEHLTDILKKDMRDMQIMKNEMIKKEADKKTLDV
mmetsp:Transcript_17866/g.23545  ORF Transcript_17866/g.23545 Transcript_17866/m.23545 type:complete len:435 (+) Transcript_17866:307-1611(+)|eukprot:CAMPEP_0117773684 /NCGR_PEP_ID=MMETSP0947-20121206/26012_1 /TAXON_ID=44440 /ORGANISM="Chattonella subsalsa, Strain CCMP2191" /LENGTH=434 /DNA_ID=CAMNT_0005599893 /DNA_START=249 /DNA_END=1553 /DNA_ORIENTATION=+